MYESKFKDYIFAINESWHEKRIKLKDKLDALSDVLNENLFVFGYTNLFKEGLLTYKRGRYKRAVFYFEKAYKAKRNDFNATYNLALAYQADNDFKQSIKYYTQALKLNEDDFDTIYNLGLCYLNTKNIELAEQYLKLALEKRPKDDDVKMSYVLYMIANNMIDDAIQKTIQIVKSNKTYLDFTLTVAKHIEEQSFGEENIENIIKVIKLLNSYIQINENNSAAHSHLSSCYGKIGNWDLALKHSLIALQLNPKSYETNKNTGLVLYCNHNYQEALKYYEKALFLNPVKNFDMHYNIALTYEKLNLKKDLERKVNYIVANFKNHPQIKVVKDLLRIKK